MSIMKRVFEDQYSSVARVFAKRQGVSPEVTHYYREYGDLSDDDIPANYTGYDQITTDFDNIVDEVIEDIRDLLTKEGDLSDEDIKERLLSNCSDLGRAKKNLSRSRFEKDGPRIALSYSQGEYNGGNKADVFGKLYYSKAWSDLVVFVAAADLLSSKKISIFQELRDVSPFFSEYGFTNVENLFSPIQRTGVDKEIANAKSADDIRKYLRHPLVRKMPESDPQFPIGSSVNANQLSVLIEELSGKSYGEYVTEKLFNPLEMRNTLFMPNNNETKRVSSIYQHSKDDISNDRGYMRMFTTTDDMIKLSKALTKERTGVLNGIDWFKADDTVCYLAKNKCRSEKRGVAGSYVKDMVVNPHIIDPLLSSNTIVFGDGYSALLVDPLNNIFVSMAADKKMNDDQREDILNGYAASLIRGAVIDEALKDNKRLIKK